MRLEFLSTGNELLDGSVVDTNASYFAGKAFELGAILSRKETVPDNLPIIAESLRRICERADFVVVSGGLGPTADDLTVDAAALAAGVGVEIDQAVLARLKERFAKRGFAFSPNNERQARVPRGATALANHFGSAPMIVLRIGRADCHLLPGVPREFRGLCDEEVIPRLRLRLESEAGRVFRASRVLKICGIPESHLDAMVSDFPGRFPEVQLGFRTHAPENHLKLLAIGSSQSEATARLEAAEREARSRIGDRLFGVDQETFPESVFAALKAARATMALAESCTGGLCASMLASVPGASEVMVSSAVVYQETAKSALLGLDPELVRREGAVSAKVTRALAEAACFKAQSTFGLAITGWAGPSGGTDQDPVGTVYVCLVDSRGAIEERHRFGLDRERVRQFAAFQALDLLRRNARGIAT
jgi:nicotinamide-nucleotide amidase